MTKRKMVNRKRRQNKFSVFLVMLVLMMTTMVVWVKRSELKDNLADKISEKAQLEMQIEEQKKVALEIEEYEKYTQTDKFAEEVAKDKLGLVNKDEIFIRPED